MFHVEHCVVGARNVPRGTFLNLPRKSSLRNFSLESPRNGKRSLCTARSPEDSTAPTNGSTAMWRPGAGSTSTPLIHTMLVPIASTGQSRRSAAEIPRRSNTSLTVFIRGYAAAAFGRQHGGVRKYQRLSSRQGATSDHTIAILYRLQNARHGHGQPGAAHCRFAPGMRKIRSSRIAPLGRYACSQLGPGPFARHALLYSQAPAMLPSARNSARRPPAPPPPAAHAAAMPGAWHEAAPTL